MTELGHRRVFAADGFAQEMTGRNEELGHRRVFAADGGFASE